MEEGQRAVEIALQGAHSFGLAVAPLLTESVVALPGLRFSLGLPDQAGLVKNRAAVSMLAQPIQAVRDGQVAQEIAQFVENAALQWDIRAVDLRAASKLPAPSPISKSQQPGVRNFICLTTNSKSPQLSSLSFSATTQVSKVRSPVCGQHPRANRIT